MIGVMLVHVIAYLVGALAVARLTRLVVDDEWPPMEWVRRLWDRRTNRSSWNTLLHCPFCVSLYFGAAWLAWAWLSDLHWSWWVASLWLSGSYLAAMVCVRDLPEDQRG